MSLNSKALADAFVAFATNQALFVRYDDKDRTIEVHAIGRSTKDDALVIRGYQVDGESSRPLPCWALLRLDGVQDSEVLLHVKSQAPRIAEGFNPSGDKQMSVVLTQLGAQS